MLFMSTVKLEVDKFVSAVVLHVYSYIIISSYCTYVGITMSTVATAEI